MLFLSISFNQVGGRGRSDSISGKSYLSDREWKLLLTNATEFKFNRTQNIYEEIARSWDFNSNNNNEDKKEWNRSEYLLKVLSGNVKCVVSNKNDNLNSHEKEKMIYRAEQVNIIPFVSTYIFHPIAHTASSSREMSLGR